MEFIIPFQEQRLALDWVLFFMLGLFLLLVVKVRRMFLVEKLT